MTDRWEHFYRVTLIAFDELIISPRAMMDFRESISYPCETNADHNHSMFIRTSTYQLLSLYCDQFVLGYNATRSVSSLLRSILQRFRQVIRLNTLAARQVRNRPAQLEDKVVTINRARGTPLSARAYHRVLQRLPHHLQNAHTELAISCARHRPGTTCKTHTCEPLNLAVYIMDEESERETTVKTTVICYLSQTKQKQWQRG